MKVVVKEKAMKAKVLAEMELRKEKLKNLGDLTPSRSQKRARAKRVKKKRGKTILEQETARGGGGEGALPKETARMKVDGRNRRGVQSD